MRLCLNIVLIGLMIINAFSCADHKEGLLTPGVSENLSAFRKSILDDVRYDLHFDIPKERSQPIQGNVKISFDLNNTNDDLILDFNAAPEKLGVIEVNGDPVEIIWKQQHILIPHENLRDQNVISIKFEAGEQSLNRYEDYLYTLFVPERASTCFPLFDQPDIKGRYQLSLTVPSAWSAVANGSETSKTKKDGQTVYTFRETMPISSYLFSFAVGDFQVISRDIGERTMRMFHRETDSVKLSKNIDVIFDWHTKSLDWLEEYTDIPYPFEKFDFVLIPSFQYGGMEHPGAVLYKASNLLLDESSTLNEQLGRARLIAHETAHMWFGDLVTMKWFNDVWLKEVFANFMAAKIVNPGFPDVNHDLQFIMAHYPGAYSVDRTKGTHPIQQPLDNLKEAGSLYGPVIYKKAPIVMRILEESIGEDLLKRSLSTYLKKYAYSNASWNDLIDLIAGEVDFNVKVWNKQWVKSAGMPDVHYTLKSKDKKIIDKLSIWSRNHQDDQVQWWNQDLEVLLGYSDSSYLVPAKLLTDAKGFDLSGKPYPEYLFLNGGGLGYGYFRMGKDSRKYFLQHLYDHADPVLRAAVWINLYEMLLRQRLKPKELMNLAIEGLQKEGEALIAEYITNVIQTVYWKLYTTEERVELAPRLEGLLLNLMLHTPSTYLKAVYFKGLKLVALSEEGVQMLKNIWREEMDLDGLTLSENDYISLSYELAVREVDNYEFILDEQEKNISNPDRKKKFKFILPALSSDPAVRNTFFEQLKQPENRENEAWVLEGIKYLHHPIRAQSAVKYIRPSLEMLQEIQLTGDIFFPQRWLNNMLDGHSSEEADNEVRQFLYRHNKYPENLKNKILQSADILFRAVEIKTEISE